MGHVSIKKAERLYWLGRYAERALSTSRAMVNCYDVMMDQGQAVYEPLLEKLGFPACLEEKEKFLKNMITSPRETSGIFYSLERANDNAMILRDELGTETTAYIQLSCNLIPKLFSEKCRISDLQKIIDMLLAFWGSVDDAVYDSETRALLKVGKFTERIAFAQRTEEAGEVTAQSRKRLLFYISQIDQEHPDSLELQVMLLAKENPEMESLNKKIVSLIQ